MKRVRFKYVFFLIFAFLFVNLLSINVSRINAEEPTIDLSNAYRGEIKDYWVLVNYGEDYVGEEQVTIFLDPEAINNQDIHYIAIAEFNDYGEIITTYFKRGMDSRFASRFSYKFVSSGYGSKSLTMFLLEDLKEEASSIVDRININHLERVRTIKDLTSVDFAVYQEVTEMTMAPYKVYVEIKENPQDYILKTVMYTYTRKNALNEIEEVVGYAIEDPTNHRYYFTVSENATYHITIEDHFGYVKPDEGDSLSITIENFYKSELIIVPTYNNKLTNQSVTVNVKLYNAIGQEYSWNDIAYANYKFGENDAISIKNIGTFEAIENGVYTISARTNDGIESTIDVNITNIDTIYPSVFISDEININSSDVDVDKGSIIFDPIGYVIATDNATLGDKLVINLEYRYVSAADPTCKVQPGEILDYNTFEYLFGVNDLCMEAIVTDEAGNTRRDIWTVIRVSDNTKPNVTSTVDEIILQIGDDMPENSELTNRFGLNIIDNSKRFDFDDLRVIIIEADTSQVDLTELGRYEILVYAIDEAGNKSDELSLTVTVTIRILVVDAVPKQYIVYGEPMKVIEYTCNGNPCRGDPENSEILPEDWDKLIGEMYIVSGSNYAGTYPIQSNLTINSNKYRIVEGVYGNFVIKQRTFKIVANSYSIDYKDDEPVMTWWMDTSVCNPDLSTKYTSFDEINYSCTFVSGDNFGGGSYVYEVKDGITYYAGGITREEGNTVRYDDAKNVIYYRITLGNLKVVESMGGSFSNYYLDFYGLYDGIEYEGYARFYIYPKYVEITVKDVTKIYGEADPNIVYQDDTEEEKFVNRKRADGKTNVQYEFTCFAYKKPINTMTTAECQQEIQMVITRENGEDVGSYKIIGKYLNENYDVRFNEEHESGALDSAYLHIVKRYIEMSVDGKDGSGKYTIFYEDKLPVITISITNDPNRLYEGLANNVFLNINDNSVIAFADRLSYGDHRVKYINAAGEVMNVVIGGYNEYIDGVGTFRIVRDTATILDLDDRDVLHNYDLRFNEGQLEVLRRQIYIKIMEAEAVKTYGDLDPVFTNAYIDNHPDYKDKNYIIDSNGRFILQIINTLENTDIVDDENYEPFDKDKLKYYLKRNNLRVGYNTIDVHDGEMVGSYSIYCERLENDTNYIIDLYDDYYFKITPRDVSLIINGGVIEFNYNNIVPKFTYTYSNTVFGDTLIGQPEVSGFVGSYRNNGDHVVRRGEITALSSEPRISVVSDIWHINDHSTGINISEFPELDLTLLKIVNGKYHIIDVEKNDTIDTGIEASEVNVMWNYTFNGEIPGFLTVIPRNVVIVPHDGQSKIYGDFDPTYDAVNERFSVKHLVDGLVINEIEAIMDSSDFVGDIDREWGEKPGTYEYLIGTLAPASKGADKNFNIVGFEGGHYFTINKRDLTLKLTEAGDKDYLEALYDGENQLTDPEFSTGFNIVNGGLAVFSNEQQILCQSGEIPCLYTDETSKGGFEIDYIQDTVEGSFHTEDILHPGISIEPINVGKYRIVYDYTIKRMGSKVDVSEYYNLQFVEITLEIKPREITIKPHPGQSKIYGETGGEGCEITYDIEPGLVKEDDNLYKSGCLQRQPIMFGDEEQTEFAGDYFIILGDLSYGPNYAVKIQKDIVYVIHKRNITLTAVVLPKTEDDEITKIPGTNKYVTIYGNEFILTYEIGGYGLANNPDLGIEDEISNNVMLVPEYNGVGEYTVETDVLMITNSINYDREYIDAILEVQKRRLEIIPEEISILYGETNIDNLVIPFSFVGNPVDYEGQLSRKEGNIVGEYEINMGTLKSKDPNFELYWPSDKHYFVTILPRPLYIIAEPKRVLFGDPEVELTYVKPALDDRGLEPDAPILGALARENGNTVGVYQINQGDIRCANYEIMFTSATYEIYYAELSAIEIYSLTNNQYQDQGKESQVRLYARFNKGADETHLGDVAWSVVKNGNINVEFEKDANNIISFTPSQTLGTYVVTATYLGISGTYQVVVRPNNVSSVYISLVDGRVTQKLGLEEPVLYSADVHLIEEKVDDMVIQWYAGDNLVCEKPLSLKENMCAFTPKFPIGKYDVYAKLNAVKSNELQLEIIDNDPPKITLAEQGKVYYIEVFTNSSSTKTKFQEPDFGYYAEDDVDSKDYLTPKVKVIYLKDSDYYTVGTYHIVYEVVDSHGHVATNYRTVIIQDTEAPVVSLVNPQYSSITLEYGQEYNEELYGGAIAVDAYDAYHGKPNLEIYVDSNLDTTRVGTYQIVYFAIDSNGLRGQVIRTVKIQDSVKPKITLNGSTDVTIEYKSVYKDAGAWFEDNYDGSYIIYPSIIRYSPSGGIDPVEVDSVDTSRLGIYYLTYYQEDSSGNKPENSVIRRVYVVDTTPPVITLLGSNPYILRYGTEYVEPGYKVIDNYDGDITNNEELVSVRQVIGDTLGTYYVYYDAKDTHSNTSVTIKREVIILDLVSPIIYFTSACPQYMTIEALVETYNTDCNLPRIGYTVYDDYIPDQEAIQDWVEVEGTVDNTTVGTYEIKYNVSDRSGNKAITLIRYVSVVDTTPPTIELKPNEQGNVNFYVEVFSEYVEHGWIARDLYDDYHGLEVSVSTTNNININKLNTYTVTYIATDSNGNHSDPIYREITVRDTVPPVVTLIGDSEFTIERGTRYPEYGATARDNYDGVINSNSITITGAPTGMNLGVFEVNYCAKDSSGNEGCAIRTVTVEDTIPPVVLGVEDGKYYRTPLYIYYDPLTGTDEILTGHLNGQLISSPWYVSKEGTYHLVVRDDAGNSVEIDFVIDMTPPKLYGANDGEYLNHPVTIYSDEKLSSITYRANNGGFVTESGIEELIFETEGQFWVYATDMAGNISQTISFVIDMTPPAYVLEGVVNGGITNEDVTLITENDVVVSVNNIYIPTHYTFTESGYYKVTIRDIAGNDVFLQFVINKYPNVTISGKTVMFISQNNAIGEFVAKADSNYPKGAGFIYAKPLIDGTFEYISGTLFSDEEYTKLTNGEDVIFDVPEVAEDEMVVAFVVTLDELNKFTTQTVEGDDDSAIIYAIIAIALALGAGGFFYFFVILKRKKDEEEEEEEIIEEEDGYF